MKFPIVSNLFRRVTVLQGIGQGTFAQGRHLVFVRGGRKLERFNQSRKLRSGVHGRLGVEGGGETGAVFAARVAGMDVVGSARPAWVLPEAAALIPMKTKTPKDIGGGAVRLAGKIEPNPAANDFSEFILGGKLGFQQVQDFLQRQFPIRSMGGEGAGF